MKLTIKYFGMIEEAVGKAEESIDFEKSILVGDLKNELITKYPSIKNKDFQIAVNQTISKDDLLVTSDSEIALLPPFAGG